MFYQLKIYTFIYIIKTFIYYYQTKYKFRHHYLMLFILLKIFLNSNFQYFKLNLIFMNYNLIINLLIKIMFIKNSLLLIMNI